MTKCNIDTSNSPALAGSVLTRGQGKLGGDQAGWASRGI